MPTEAQNKFMRDVLAYDAAVLPPAGPGESEQAPGGSQASEPAGYPKYDPVAAAKQKARLKAERERAFEASKHARIVQTNDGTIRQHADPKGLLVPKPLPVPPAPPAVAEGEQPRAAPNAPQQEPAPRRPAYDPVAAAIHLEKSRNEAFQKMKEFDAVLDRELAELEALKAKMGEKPKRSGGAMPSFAELLGDTGPAMKAMQHLDLAKTKQWVVFNGKQTETKDVMKFYASEAVKMSGALGQIVSRSLRDLKRILAEHGSGDGRDEVLDKVSKTLPKAGQQAEAATACFLHQPPEFEKGMHALISGLRLNQLTGEMVQDWSQGAIETADRSITVIRTTRDISIGAVTAVFIVTTAPAFMAAAGISALTAGAKLAINAGDFVQEGKPVPWGELTFAFVLDVVGGLVATRLGDLCKPAANYFVATKRGQALIARGIKEAHLAAMLEQGAKEVVGVGSDFVKGIALELWKGRPKEDQAMAAPSYFWKLIRSRFEGKEAINLLVGRLTERLSETLKAGKA